jgi:hypothetical protein
MVQKKYKPCAVSSKPAVKRRCKVDIPKPPSAALLVFTGVFKVQYTVMLIGGIPCEG